MGKVAERSGSRERCKFLGRPCEHTHRAQKKTKKKGQIGKEGGSIVFWNVAGLLGKDRGFWEFVEKQDFVGFTETWIEESRWNKIKGRLPKGFI